MNSAPYRRGIIFLLVAAWCGVCAASDIAYLYDSKGKRDPFTPLIGQQRQMGSIEDVISIDDVKLEGIAGIKGKRVAILNGTMLREGDKAGIVEVKTVGKASVTVVIDGREHDLDLVSD